MRAGKCPQCGSTKYTNDDLLPNMAVRQAVARFKQTQMMSATETMRGSQGQPAGQQSMGAAVPGAPMGSHIPAAANSGPAALGAASGAPASGSTGMQSQNFAGVISETHAVPMAPEGPHRAALSAPDLAGSAGSGAGSGAGPTNRTASAGPGSGAGPGLPRWALGPRARQAPGRGLAPCLGAPKHPQSAAAGTGAPLAAEAVKGDSTGGGAAGVGGEDGGGGGRWGGAGWG